MEIDEFLDQRLGKPKEAKPSEEGSELPEEVRRALQEKAPAEGQLFAETPEPALAAPEKAPQRGELRAGEDEIESLIAQANAMISRGDFEGARQIYLQIKGVKKDLPRRFVRQDERISEGLVNLNEKIVQGVEKTLSTEFGEKFSRITALLDEAYSYVREGKITSIESLSRVEEIYQRIKQLHLAFPEGYIEKRVMIEDQMLKLYRIIILSKKNLLYDDFVKKSQEIIRTMNIVADEMGRGNFENASKLFSTTTKLYKGLPKGFLREKTELQGKILDIYQKLIMGRESTAYTEFERKYSEIKGLFTEAYSLAKQDDIKGAADIYSRIAELYSRLPAGYFSRKSEIEMEMMEFYHLLSLKKDKALLEETKARLNEIDLLVESAKNYLANRETDLAKEVYDEAIEVYNSLPDGFFEQKSKTQAKLIRIYKDLLAAMHELSAAKDEERAKYEGLLKLLVEIHTRIKRGEFGEIKSRYLAAYRLYHELPLSLMEEKKSIYHELYRIYEELRLYTSLDKISELAESAQYREMADLLDKTAEEYNLLLKKYPQDMELFRHIQSKCLLYLDMLKRLNQQKKERSGAEVRKRIEEVAAAKEGLGSELPVQKYGGDYAPNG